MYAAVDSRWVESQPVYENSPYMYMFFICFIIISSFFTLNFFIRAILDNLQRNKSAGKHIFITEEQHKEWMAVKKRLRTPPRAVPRPQVGSRPSCRSASTVEFTFSQQSCYHVSRNQVSVTT
ncbi:sodium channel protein type 4 subunit alpha B-like isoform X1 [Epinephelus moara]|uniref:sodium channel protein type 4 subunit alpha B-like isoform X1 n=1 Tax=Epinephelus moara TaxID=300413 RepID=UPI00214EDE13|nr:sodium channel protein type 4 subunit alpha B-like isoform X1 [Epinephelus moara]